MHKKIYQVFTKIIIYLKQYCLLFFLNKYYWNNDFLNVYFLYRIFTAIVYLEYSKIPVFIYIL